MFNILDIIPNLLELVTAIINSKNSNKQQVRLTRLYARSFKKLNRLLKKRKINQEQYNLLELELTSKINNQINLLTKQH